MTPRIGLLVWAELGRRQPPGHEQEGRRPCVIVAVPGQVHAPRFPLVVVAPLTTAALPARPLYPRLPAGSGGLSADSTVLLDQVVAIDVTRVRRRIGALAAPEYQPIREGLRQLFGL